MKLKNDVYINRLKISHDSHGKAEQAIFECILDLPLPDEEKKLIKMNKKRVKMTLEMAEPILDETERKYLKGVIKPYRNNVAGFAKDCFNQNYEFIIMKMKNEGDVIFPNFKTGTMYKGMKLGRAYSLEELEL